MGEFVRTLTFRSRNLGRNSTLLLTFNDDSTPGMYKTVFPIAWKVTVFEATGLHEFPVTYVHKLGFTRAVINGAVLDPPSTYTNINVGQRTELSKSGHPATYEFSTPQTITPPTKESVATNVTNGSENIGVCFFNSPTGPPSELLVFEDVKAGLSVHSEFTPILRAYVTTEFCQNEVMKGHSITPVLFRENLVDLPENSNWLLRWIVGPGNYIIERDLSHYWDY